MNVAIIPARGGSKRIPKKNIKLFHGKPIIAYSIELALQSGIFDLVIVSTDCDEIAEVSRQYGAEVPFRRPEALSNDYAGTVPVLCHAEEWLLSAGYNIEKLCCIYPTSPLLTAAYLIEGAEVINKQLEFNIAFSAVKYSYPVQRSFYRSDIGSVKMLWPECYQARSQDLPSVYHDTGQFYWWRSKTLTEDSILFGEHSYAVELPEIQVQDIDTEQDWLLAEQKYKFFKYG